jgi:hypothetical protein
MDVIPDEHKLLKIIEKVEAEQAAQLQLQTQGTSPVGGSQPGSGQVPNKKPRTLDNSGVPAGGTDVNTAAA